MRQIAMGDFRKCRHGSQRQIDNLFFGCGVARLNDAGCKPTGVNDPGYRGGAEFFLPIDPRTLQSLLDASNDCVADIVWITETDFAFRWMDVYIDERRIEIEQQKRDRILSFHQRRAITLAHRIADERTFDWRPIDAD